MNAEDDHAEDEDGLNLVKAFGAAENAAIQCLTLYIPSKDRLEEEIDQRRWVEEALRLLSIIGGGATSLPPVDGAWLDPDTGTLKRERVVLVYTYVDADKFERSINDLRKFLHRMGRETNQGEIVVEFDNRLYKIRSYDPA